MRYLLALVALALWGLLPIAVDPDAFWHLRLGRELLAGNGAIVGPESLSPLSSAIVVDHSWLHGLLIALADRVAGAAGAGLIGALPFFLLVVAAEGYLRLRLPSATWYDRLLIIALIAAIARPVTLPRAGTYDAAFAVLLLACFLLPRPRITVLLPLIVGAWTMLHGAGVLLGLGLMIVGLATRWSTRQPIGDALRGTALAIGVVLLLPGGVESALYPFQVVASPAQRLWIAEWQSPLLIGSIALLPAAVALFVGGLALVRGRGRDLRTHELLLTLPLLMAALLSTRWLLLACTIGGLLLAPAVAAGLRGADGPRREPGRERRLGMVLTVVIVLMAAGRVTVFLDSAAAHRGYPVRLMTEAAPAEWCGVVVAPYDWGGYLLAHGVDQVALYGDAGAIEAGGVDLAAWFEAEAGLRPILPLADAAGAHTIIVTDGSPIERELRTAAWSPRQRVADEAVLYRRPGVTCP